MFNHRTRWMLSLIVLALCLGVLAAPLAAVTAQEDGIRTLPFTGEMVNHALSPDGRILALHEIGMLHADEMIADYLPVRLLDLESGAVTPLTGPTDYATDLAFTPNGAVLASYHGNGFIWLWDVATGTAIKRIPAVPGGAQIAYYPDGRLLAVMISGIYPMITIWDTEAEQIAYVLAERADTLREYRDRLSERVAYSYTALAIPPTEGRLAVVNTYDEVLLWELNGENPVVARESGEDLPLLAVAGLSYLPDGETVVFHDRRESILYVWNTYTGTEVTSLPVESRVQPAVAPAGDRVAWVDDTLNAIIIWDLAAAAESEVIMLPSVGDIQPTRTTALSFSADGSRLVFSGFLARNTGENAAVVIDLDE